MASSPRSFSALPARLPAAHVELKAGNSPHARQSRRWRGNPRPARERAHGSNDVSSCIARYLHPRVWLLPGALYGAQVFLEAMALISRPPIRVHSPSSSVPHLLSTNDRHRLHGGRPVEGDRSEVTQEFLIHWLREPLLSLPFPTTTSSLDMRTVQRCEMIMSYAAHLRDSAPSLTMRLPSPRAAPKRMGILRRIFDAFMESRQRDVDRQITRFLTVRSAERLTDDLERDVFRRLSTSNWSANASAYGERRFP
jgi:hypothetical protein